MANEASGSVTRRQFLETTTAVALGVLAESGQAAAGEEPATA